MSRANTSELVGAVAYVHASAEDVTVPDKIWRFHWRNPGTSPVFYATLLRTQTMRRRMSSLASGSGGSMKNISKVKLEAMPIPNVSAKNQQAFAAKVKAIQEERDLVATALEADNELFNALQYRAFRGEL